MLPEGNPSANSLATFADMGPLYESKTFCPRCPDAAPPVYLNDSVKFDAATIN
jgi:hypothetical protein